MSSNYGDHTTQPPLESLLQGVGEEAQLSNLRFRWISVVFAQFVEQWTRSSSPQSYWGGHGSLTMTCLNFLQMMWFRWLLQVMTFSTYWSGSQLSLKPPGWALGSQLKDDWMLSLDQGLVSTSSRGVDASHDLVHEWWKTWARDRQMDWVFISCNEGAAFQFTTVSSFQPSLMFIDLGSDWKNEVTDMTRLLRGRWRVCCYFSDPNYRLPLLSLNGYVSYLRQRH